LLVDIVFNEAPLCCQLLLLVCMLTGRVGLWLRGRFGGGCDVFSKRWATS